jgi:hypothetical protein
MLAGQSLALPLSDADAAYARGDYASAYSMLLPLAEQGSVHAQERIAEMYDKGLGVPRNTAKAKEWYQRAALQAARDAELQMEASQGLASQTVPAPTTMPTGPVIGRTTNTTPLAYPSNAAPAYTAPPPRVIFVPVGPRKYHHHGYRH